MSHIHINRDRETLGQFTPEEVAKGLRDGTFFESDLGWQQGMEAWKPLGEWHDLPAVSESAPPLPQTTSHPSASTPPLPETPSAATPTATPEPQGNSPEEDENAAAGDLPAWEHLQQVGFLTATSQTIRQVLLEPTKTFARLKRSGGLLQPLLYAILMGCVGGGMAVLYQMGILLIAPDQAPTPLLGKVGSAMMALFALLFFLPLVVIIQTFLSAALCHGFLFLLGGARRGFETTFRVFCYGDGSSKILLLIPFCGSIFQAVWAFLAIVIGLKEAHQTDTWRALAALVLPLIFCVGLVMTPIILAASKLSQLGAQ